MPQLSIAWIYIILRFHAHHNISMESINYRSIIIIVIISCICLVRRIIDVYQSKSNQLQLSQATDHAKVQNNDPKLELLRIYT